MGEVKEKMKNKAMLPIAAVLLLAAISLAPLLANPLVTSFETGGGGYDETVGEDIGYTELPEEVIVAYTEGDTGIENLILIYTIDMDNGYNALLIPSSSEERYIEIVVSYENMIINELYLENITTEYIDETVTWECEDCECDTDIAEKNKNETVTQILEGGVAISGTLSMTTGSSRVYTRFWYLKGGNAFGQTQWKNTAKGRFHFNGYRLDYIEDLSSTWTCGNWAKEWHIHWDTPYTTFGKVTSQAQFKAMIWPIPPIYQKCQSKVYIRCYFNGAWKHADSGKCWIDM